jgi:hypothetical protein
MRIFHLGLKIPRKKKYYLSNIKSHPFQRIKEEHEEFIRTVQKKVAK